MKKILLCCHTPKEALDSLIALGYTLVLLSEYDALPAPVCSHCDMLVYPYKDGILTYRGYFEQNRDVFDGIKVYTTDITPQPCYPYDIALNALRLGEKIFCLCSHTAPEITKDGECVNIRQGYARCSTLKIDENAVCTADKSIYNAVKANGMEATLIEAGYIALQGFDYGFIGGASIEMTDAIAFFGELNTHPDANKITAAVKSRGKSIITLCKGQLKDIGGGLIIF